MGFNSGFKGLNILLSVQLSQQCVKMSKQYDFHTLLKIFNLCSSFRMRNAIYHPHKNR